MKVATAAISHSPAPAAIPTPAVGDQSVERGDEIGWREMDVDPETAAADRDNRFGGDRRVGDHRPRRRRPERRDGVSLVARRRACLVGVREGHSAYAEELPELRPVKPPASRNEDEQVIALAASDDDRPQELAS